MATFVLVHIWGDESGVASEKTDIVPPDGKLLQIGIPNSDDALFVVDTDHAINNAESLVPDHLQEEFLDEIREHI